MPYQFGPDHPDTTYVPHGYPEHSVDLGEVVMNYATAGSPDNPALLLIPGQTESWWGFERAMGLLENEFQVIAVDLRGQGRSSRPRAGTRWTTWAMIWRGSSRWSWGGRW